MLSAEQIREEQYARGHVYTDSFRHSWVHANTHAYILEMHELM